MNTLRIVLGYVVIILLWLAPIIMKKRGAQFWQAGFLWKYLLYFVGVFIFQLALTGAFGALVVMLSGGKLNLDSLFLALTLLMAVEIAIISWVIFRRH